MKYDHDPLYNPILPNVKIEQTDDHIEIGKWIFLIKTTPLDWGP